MKKILLITVIFQLLSMLKKSWLWKASKTFLSRVVEIETISVSQDTSRLEIWSAWGGMDRLHSVSKRTAAALSDTTGLGISQNSSRDSTNCNIFILYNLRKEKSTNSRFPREACGPLPEIARNQGTDSETLNSVILAWRIK